MWVLLVLLYGVIKGVREVIKKKALTKNTVIEVLFFYTLLSLIFVLPEAPRSGGVEPVAMAGIAFKSFAIFLAWIFSFKAINRMPISFYGVIDLSRVLFATVFGLLILGESMETGQVAGLILVLTGLLMLKRKKRDGTTSVEKIEAKYIIYSIASCALNATSGLMDKLLMREVSDSQLQFWYMIFLVLYYSLYIVLTRTKLNYRAMFKNYWIWILAVIFVIGDRALFMANAYPDSKVTIMTLIKQSGCVVTILAGKFIFKEKNITYKLICAGIVIIGIVLSVWL